MKIFNSHSAFISADIASLSWAVELNNGADMSARLFIVYNGLRINLHSHYTDKLLEDYRAKMRLLHDTIQEYLAQDGSTKCGNRLWLNDGSCAEFMLGTASYHVDPEDTDEGYHCFTVADCQRRLFFFGRNPRLLTFLRELAVATASIVSAVEFTVERLQPADDQTAA